MTDIGEPTPERRRRSTFLTGPAIATDAGPARAGTRIHRALSTLERLAKAGVLEPRQAEAGERLRADWELGPLGARDTGSGSSGHTGWYYAEATLAATRRFQDACTALGPLKLYVSQFVLLEMSISQCARAWNRNRQETAGILKLGLTTLADHYGIDLRSHKNHTQPVDKPKHQAQSSR